MILSVCCLKRFQLLKKMPNEAVFKPLKGIFVGTAVFSMSNTIINHVLKTQTVNEDVFMSTREDVLLEEVSRCSLYLG